MKSGCLPLLVFVSWPDAGPDASSRTASSPTAIGPRTQHAKRIAYMVISLFECLTAALPVFAASTHLPIAARDYHHEQTCCMKQLWAKRWWFWTVIGAGYLLIPVEELLSQWPAVRLRSPVASVYCRSVSSDSPPTTRMSS